MREPSTAALEHFVEDTASTRGFGVSGDPTVRYRLMSPDSPRLGDPYPLVVFLHGAGERGKDNRSQIIYLPEVLARPECRERYPCYALAVQCAADDKWADVDWGMNGHWRSLSMTRAMRILRAITQIVLSQNEIGGVLLTGISMGGFGCWQWAGSQPQMFAAVAPICETFYPVAVSGIGGRGGIP